MDLSKKIFLGNTAVDHPTPRFPIRLDHRRERARKGEMDAESRKTVGNEAAATKLNQFAPFKR